MLSPSLLSFPPHFLMLHVPPSSSCCLIISSMLYILAYVLPCATMGVSICPVPIMPCHTDLSKYSSSLPPWLRAHCCLIPSPTYPMIPESISMNLRVKRCLAQVRAACFVRLAGAIVVSHLLRSHAQNLIEPSVARAALLAYTR